MKERITTITRKTKETDIRVTFSIDGTGKSTVSTGIGFFDHMLEGFLKHGFFDGELHVKGDLFVDGHHTVEDLGIVIGTAIKDALGTKEGIKRYGSKTIPMDDVLMLCSIDLCGRPYLNFDCDFKQPQIGGMDTELFREFFYAISYSAGMNLHIVKMSGDNTHHQVEAMFKAFGRALDEATSMDARIKGTLSTKGVLA
ncbi:MAG: imidazoleglycerol-phosphate dehydratase HisB [Lachnospiraceae bacterium]